MRSLATLRRPRNATPVSYSGPRPGLTTGWAGQHSAAAQLRAYGQVGTLYAIVDRIANAVSQVDWRLYRKSTDARRVYAPTEPARVEVTRHAALDLWRVPNPFMDRQLLVESVQQHLELVGEGCVVIGRDPRSPMPLELWPVRPDRVAPVPSATEYLVGYVYTAPGGERVPLRLDEVLWLRRPNPVDPYRGLGPVQPAMVDVESARYSAEWNRNFFINSAEPGGIIEIDKRLTDDEFDEMVQRWREQHQGVTAAHRVAVLEQGKWVPNAITQRDMQFAELRNLSREVLRETYGIHGHMLGNSQDVNKANAEAGEASFGKWLVYPRVQRWKAILNTRLLPLFDAGNLEFDHAGVVPPDREADDRERSSKTGAIATLTAAGYDPADVLRTVGWPDMAVAELPPAPPPTGDGAGSAQTP